ncbi:uncharacterized protein TRIADDRAFT_61470 [Trichoplax adhaerens]|uniref:Uncharacterized protein n=1 Tax=Trichoplax adhaerens TaxID=10228 RepID=B3SB28_TRIAD|nr:predicted protein [Trichoplax adhaerens]EDV20090.1 predicted protein [Trichoplax adhaerens]|eukprot:XP_002117474.1 predicted protein [Trichoplax adhaerens]
MDSSIYFYKSMPIGTTKTEDRNIILVKYEVRLFWWSFPLNRISVTVHTTKHDHPKAEPGLVLMQYTGIQCTGCVESRAILSEYGMVCVICFGSSPQAEVGSNINRGSFNGLILRKIHANSSNHQTIKIGLE